MLLIEVTEHIGVGVYRKIDINMEVAIGVSEANDKSEYTQTDILFPTAVCSTKESKEEILCKIHIARNNGDSAAVAYKNSDK